MNKKGDIGDFVIFITIIFIFAIAIFFGSQIWFSMKGMMLTSTPIGTVNNTNMTKVLDKVSTSFNFLDYAWLIFFIGFYLVMLISVFSLESHPFFFVFAIIMFAATLLYGAIISDLFMSIANETQLLEAQASHPIIYHVMNYLPIYLVPMGILFMIVLYSSRRSGGGI
jgi:hypothetical protein